MSSAIQCPLVKKLLVLDAWFEERIQLRYILQNFYIAECEAGSVIQIQGFRPYYTTTVVNVLFERLALPAA